MIARRGYSAMMLFALLPATAIAGCSAVPDASEETVAQATPEAAAATPEVLLPAPDLSGVELRNQNDQAVTIESLRGKPALLTFIYTRCPLPEMCPATTLRFQEVQKALSAEERARVRLIAVSFDPDNDTPEVLADYAALWEVDDSLWSLLTGDAESIQRVAAAYGVWYEKAEDGSFRHAMYTMVLFPDGALHEVLPGSAWDSAEIARLLVDMANESDGAAPN